MTGWCSRGSRLWWESPRLVWDELGALLETHRAHVVHAGRTLYVAHTQRTRSALCTHYAHAVHGAHTVLVLCTRYARTAHALCVCAAALCLVRFSLCLEYSCLQ